MKERDISNKFRKFFSEKSKDFDVEQEFSRITKNGRRILDFVIFYGTKPLACIEVKSSPNEISEKYLVQQLKSIQESVETINFYFCLVNEKYLYYDLEVKRLEEKEDNEIFEMLFNAVQNNSVPSDQLLLPFKELIDRNEKWGNYGTKLKNHLTEKKLLVHGKNAFLEMREEMDLMRDLLMSSSHQDKIGKICRYTSAKTLKQSLENRFRINSVEAMNDGFETKVIDEFPNLLTTKIELADYVYNGYVMPFSTINRKDKLLNWYMYGDRAKGVCLIAEKKEEFTSTDDHFFIAPVVYIPASKKRKELTLLDFLNDLMGVKIKDDYKFKLRFWHFWKYFFKYDYYEEEQEIRLLCIKRNDDSIKSEWSAEYNAPYHYVEKGINEMPFHLKEVVLGPKCESKESYKQYLKNKSKELKVGFKVSDSEIVGYR